MRGIVPALAAALCLAGCAKAATNLISRIPANETASGRAAISMLR